MEYSGGLEDQGLEKILSDIRDHGWSGTLLLFSEKVRASQPEAYLLFSAGRLVTAYKQREPEQFAMELVWHDLVPPSQLQSALSKSMAEDRRLEDVLLRQGTLSDTQLRSAYEKVLAERLRVYMTWTHGSYVFTVSEDGTGADAWSHMALANDDLFLPQGADTLDLLEIIRRDLPQMVLTNPFADDDRPEEEIEGKLLAPVQATSAGFVNLGAELGMDQPESADVLAENEINFLSSMLNELHQPVGTVDLTLLLLRYLSHVFARGILFKAVEGGLKSLGEFGFGESDGDLIYKIRQAVFPLGHEGFLAEAVHGKHAVRRGFQGGVTESAFFEFMESAPPVDLYVAPVLSQDRVFAVIYGDQGGSQALTSLTTGLEIFLGQVKFSLEKKLLQERLEEVRQERDA